MSNIEQGIPNIEVKKGQFPDSLPDIRHQRHEAGPLDGVFHCSLEGGAGAAPLFAIQLALARAQLLETLHVLIIDVGRPRAAFLSAEPAAIFPPSP